MKRNLFVISESERKRILGMHKDAIRKQYLSEQTQYIKDAAGKVSMLQGSEVAPQGSTVITQQEYETALKTQQPPANQPVADPATATPAAPAPATPATPAAPAPAAPATATPAPAEPNPNSAQGGDTSATSKFGVDYKYNYPGDKSYVYGYKDGKWYTKSVTKNVEFDLSTNPKWKSTVDNLNKQFASQIKEPTTPLPVKSLSSMTVQNNVGNQQLATGTQPTGTQPTGQAVTTQTDPQVSADLKSASQIRQEFRQGKRDIAKLQRERGKLYKTFNKLSGKMDNATKQSYLNNIAELDKLLSQK